MSERSGWPMGWPGFRYRGLPPGVDASYLGLRDDAPLTPEEVVAGLEARGVRVLGRIGGRFRAVTHYSITRRGRRPRRVRYGGSDRLIDRPQAPVL